VASVTADLDTRAGERYPSGDEILPAGEAGCDGAVIGQVDSSRWPGDGAAAGFGASREQFASLVGFLDGSDAAGLAHGELEERLDRDGRELLRRLLDDHLALRAIREQPLELVVGDEEVARSRMEKGHQRGLATVFGEVSVLRLAYRAPGLGNLHPADAALNLPVEHHSHGLRRLAALEAPRGSFDDAVSGIERACGQRLGKRQVQELAALAAVDFEDFYAARQPAPAKPADLLVISADAKGIVMRPDALRPKTKAAKTRAGPKPKTRLAGEEKRGRKRMAEIGAVYDATAAPRTAADIMSRGQGEQGEPTPGPVATNKWLCASIVKDAAVVIEQVLEEAQRRDPEHHRRWVALVDGNNHHCDTRSHATSEKRKIGGSANVESVIPGPYSTACPHPDVRRRFRPVGFGARGKAQGRPFHPGVTGKGKPGRVKNLNLRLMPRHVDPRWWDAGTGSKDWPLGSGRRRLGMVPSRDEYRRPRGTGGTHPGRISCAWNVVTPVGVRCCSAGKPTARKAQSPGGNLMVEKRMPAVERQQETGT
jgi:hypothetical protein